MCCFFFFSSRRRHTRCSRDWSSDVCSSDLMFSVATALVGGPPARGQEVSPPWAYVLNPPDFKPSPDDGTLRRVPNSSAAFTLTQLRDLFFAPDWHPEDHPAMPPIVSQGRPTK